jgi:hypothetical protein
MQVSHGSFIICEPSVSSAAEGGGVIMLMALMESGHLIRALEEAMQLGCSLF